MFFPSAREDCCALRSASRSDEKSSRRFGGNNEGVRAFRGAEHQRAVRSENVGQFGKDRCPGRAIEIEQHVAAEDEIDFARRVFLAIKKNLTYEYKS